MTIKKTSLLLLILCACEGSTLDRTFVPSNQDGGAQGLDRGFTFDGAAPVDGGVGLDGGLDPDGGSEPDANPLDVGMDAGFGDAVVPDSGPADTGLVPCGFDEPGPADKARVIVLGHPFGAQSGMPGTDIRTLNLATDGTITDDGTRIDLGFRVARLEMVPSGEILLALGEDGELASLRVNSATNLNVLDQIQLPAAGYGDLRIAEDGQTVIVAGENVDQTSGLSTVYLACDGRLIAAPNEFFNIRLSSSFVMIPGTSQVVLLGGQTVFAPIDPDDLRVLSRTPGQGFTSVNTFDIWMDFIDALRIGATPDGRIIIVPNGSPFSNEGSQASVLQLNGNNLSELERLTGLDDAREVIFSPDGTTALISLLSPGHLAVITDPGTGWAEVDRIRGIGLAEQLAMVSRGALSGRVYVPSVDANGGPNLASVAFGMPGVVSNLGQIELGSGNEEIPGPIAITP